MFINQGTIKTGRLIVNGNTVLSGDYLPSSVKKNIKKRGGEVHVEDGQVVLQGGGAFSEGDFKKLAAKQEDATVYKLCKAAQDGDVEMINNIISFKYIKLGDLLKGMSHGYSALHFACDSKGDADILAKRKLAAKRLVELGASVELKSEANQQTPLEKIKDKAFAAELENFAKDCNQESFHFASLVAKNEREEVLAILSKNRLLLNRPFNNKAVEYTPFYYACAYGAADTAKLLIEEGAETNVCGGKNKNLALDVIPKNKPDLRQELEACILQKQLKAPRLDAGAAAPASSLASVPASAEVSPQPDPMLHSFNQEVAATASQAQSASILSSAFLNPPHPNPLPQGGEGTAHRI